MYRLTRDDGVELTVSGNGWEAALELASLYGWKPAGTVAAQAVAQDRRGGARAAHWNRLDYFSRESQRVGTRDAMALAQAILRALDCIPDRGASAEGSSRALATVLPSRLSANADGVTALRRKLLQRLARFAKGGAFRITGST